MAVVSVLVSDGYNYPEGENEVTISVDGNDVICLDCDHGFMCIGINDFMEALRCLGHKYQKEDEHGKPTG